ncbi:hypothetical protein GOP47_0008589 [Adiantum capillus-veneris]|uniref:Pentatricopeptide repeat-containing protein n=1 Tax=Adiantum capillus-veneris TaxID=13818 RepID=A0A9D4ZIB9_ADICA|nr:hypothetical protein GOP47_0008589 [Adiantum capillus-veneris]
MHTQALNCQLKPQFRILQHTSNIERRPVIDPGILETVSLEEALAVLNSEAYRVSVQGFIHILQKCRRSKSLDYVKQVRKHIQDHDLEVHNVLGSYLVPTLVECGSLRDAHLLFGLMSYHNEYSWTALIQGYVDCGESERAFRLYHDMQSNRINPNTYTFQSLLRGCIKLKSIERGRKLHFEIAEDGLEGHPFVASALVDIHAGLMRKGKHIFDTMESEYGISPTIEHYNSVLDLLGRAGRLTDAMEWLEEMPFKPNFGGMLSSKTLTLAYLNVTSCVVDKWNAQLSFYT